MHTINVASSADCEPDFFFTLASFLAFQRHKKAFSFDAEEGSFYLRRSRQVIGWVKFFFFFFFLFSRHLRTLLKIGWRWDYHLLHRTQSPTLILQSGGETTLMGQIVFLLLLLVLQPSLYIIVKIGWRWDYPLLHRPPQSPTLNLSGGETTFENYIPTAGQRTNVCSSFFKGGSTQVPQMQVFHVYNFFSFSVSKQSFNGTPVKQWS